MYLDPTYLDPTPHVGDAISTGKRWTGEESTLLLDVLEV
jgi:hypothetical protein